MGVFEMVVAIVAISVIGGVISKSIKIKAEMHEKHSATDNDQTSVQLAELEKRLIVLEQIVTSEGYDLKQQFKKIESE